jgi:hypothetical protein
MSEFMGTWAVYVIRREYPRYFVLHVDSLSEGEKVKNRVFCPHYCPLDYECPTWRKPICTLKAVAYIVPYPDDKDMPFRIFFKWEDARDFALKLAQEVRVRQEILYDYETQMKR